MFVRAGGKYSVQEGGLLVRNVTHLDAGKYTCRAFETTSQSSVAGKIVIDLKVRREYLPRIRARAHAFKTCPNQVWIPLVDVITLRRIPEFVLYINNARRISSINIRFTKVEKNSLDSFEKSLNCYRLYFYFTKYRTS